MTGNTGAEDMKEKGTVVLFQPSVRVGRERQPRMNVPLGLLAIATPLDMAGYQVTVIDQYFDRQWKARLRSELEKNPICVGVSVKTGPQIRNALEVSKLVKAQGDIPMVWGGVHPSLLPEQTLENENIDIIVQGEGEETFFELVQALERGENLGDIKGIWYKENGIIKQTPPRPFIDLNTHPYPSYHFVDVKRHLVKIFGIDHLRFSSSRGCPHDCGFCYNAVFNKRKWRALTAERTVDELVKLRNTYGVRGFNLTDDFFFGDSERVKKIFAEMVKRKLDIVFSKIDMHGDEIAKLDDNFLALLEKAGCKTLVLGIESGSQRILDLIHKDISISQIIDFNKRIQKFQICPKYCFMLGFPTETEQDISDTISLIFKLIEDNDKLLKDINLYTPYPGTELFDISVQNGLKPPEKLEDWVSFNWRTINRKNTPWITKEREKLLKMLHFSSNFLEKNYYLNPIRQTNPLVTMLARLYHPLAKMRVKNLFYRFPIEIKLVEWLHLYTRQE
ncbi:B12-binding domain-containing radical SAM protein [Candidatus Latescibacterota bacterium]